MHIAIAETGPQGCRKMIPLCLLIAAINPVDGLEKLEALLRENGIETKRHLGQWLKWENTLFSVRRIGSEDDLGRMLKAVHALERRELESEEGFRNLLRTNLA